MNKRKLIIIISCIVVVAIASILTLYFINKNSSEEDNNIKAGIIGDDIKLNFLDFTVFDSEEKEVKLYDYKGMPIILSFWTSTQECVNQLELYEKVYPEVQDKVKFLFINLTDDETESKKYAERFIQTKEINLPVFYDLKQSAAKSYNVKQSPASIFIDKEGNVINNKYEMISEDMIRANIDILLGNF